MERIWNIICFYIGLNIVQLCSGLPINNLTTGGWFWHGNSFVALLGIIVTICAIIFLIGCVCCQRRQGFKEFRDSPVSASVVSEQSEDPGHVNPIATSEFTIFTPLSPPHHNNNVFRSAQARVPSEGPQQPACKTNSNGLDLRSWFDGSRLEFPRSKLKYIKELGNGWFGRVVQGEAQGITNEEGWTPVAVRILETSASAHEQSLFLHEASMYRLEPSHPNMLQLLGHSLEATPLLLIQEHCSKGDLKKFLLENANSAHSSLVSNLPLRFCCQLTSALQYLHEHNMPHPDLAARTCQLTTDLNIKLGDYGTAVHQYPRDYYQGTPAIPVRWCAPEMLNYTNTTLQPKQMTIAGNIWSLGVTLWEICEWATQPYDWLTDDEVISQVLDEPNIRLPKPVKLDTFYVDHLYRLMQLCWASSEQRPDINHIYDMLIHLLQLSNNNTPSKGKDFSLEDFESRWESFKPNTIVKTDNQINELTVPEKITDISSVSSVGESYVNEEKKSASLTNLHGSFDNLLTDEETAPHTELDSWLQNVASDTGDMNYVQGLSQAINALDSALASEQTSSSSSSYRPSPGPEQWDTPKIEFKLGERVDSFNPSSNEPSSLMDSILYPRNESGSETEDETWKKRIERGAYSEKVRQKSKSVADLMILTHIDCSDTDSETPLQSLDLKRENSQYKNVRCASRGGMENSMVYGSEGNLLTVEDTFQEELRKLQEERRDSLLFVPATSSPIESPEKENIEKSLDIFTNEGERTKEDVKKIELLTQKTEITIPKPEVPKKDDRQTQDYKIVLNEQTVSSKSNEPIESMVGDTLKNIQLEPKPLISQQSETNSDTLRESTADIYFKSSSLSDENLKNLICEPNSEITSVVSDLSTKPNQQIFEIYNIKINENILKNVSDFIEEERKSHIPVDFEESVTSLPELEQEERTSSDLYFESQELKSQETVESENDEIKDVMEFSNESSEKSGETLELDGSNEVENKEKQSDSEIVSDISISSLLPQFEEVNKNEQMKTGIEKIDDTIKETNLKLEVKEDILPNRTVDTSEIQLEFPDLPQLEIQKEIEEISENIIVTPEFEIEQSSLDENITKIEHKETHNFDLKLSAKEVPEFSPTEDDISEILPEIKDSKDLVQTTSQEILSHSDVRNITSEFLQREIYVPNEVKVLDKSKDGHSQKDQIEVVGYKFKKNVEIINKLDNIPKILISTVETDELSEIESPELEKEIEFTKIEEISENVEPEVKEKTKDSSKKEQAEVLSEYIEPKMIEEIEEGTKKEQIEQICESVQPEVKEESAECFKKQQEVLIEYVEPEMIEETGEYTKKGQIEQISENVQPAVKEEIEEYSKKQQHEVLIEHVEPEMIEETDEGTKKEQIEQICENVQPEVKEESEECSKKQQEEVLIEYFEPKIIEETEERTKKGQIELSSEHVQLAMKEEIEECYKKQQQEVLIEHVEPEMVKETEERTKNEQIEHISENVQPEMKEETEKHPKKEEKENVEPEIKEETTECPKNEQEMLIEYVEPEIKGHFKEQTIQQISENIEPEIKEKTNEFLIREQQAQGLCEYIEPEMIEESNELTKREQQLKIDENIEPEIKLVQESTEKEQIDTANIVPERKEELEELTEEQADKRHEKLANISFEEITYEELPKQELEVLQKEQTQELLDKFASSIPFKVSEIEEILPGAKSESKEAINIELIEEINIPDDTIILDKTTTLDVQYFEKDNTFVVNKTEPRDFLTDFTTEDIMKELTEPTDVLIPELISEPQSIDLNKTVTNVSNIGTTNVSKDNIKSEETPDTVKTGDLLGTELTQEVPTEQIVPESSGNQAEIPCDRKTMSKVEDFLQNERLHSEPIEKPKVLSPITSDLLDFNTTNVKPQVYNVFNVTIDHKTPDLTSLPEPIDDELIKKLCDKKNGLKDPKKLVNGYTDDFKNCEIPKLADMILDKLKDTEPEDLNGKLFTSTPFIKRTKPKNDNDVFSYISEGDENQSSVILGPCEDYTLELYSGLKTTFGKYCDVSGDRPEEEILQFSSNFMPFEYDNNMEGVMEAGDADANIDYSLETWDKFLGKTLEDNEKTYNTFSPRLESLKFDETFERIGEPNVQTFILQEKHANKEKCKEIEVPEARTDTKTVDTTLKTNANTTFDVAEKTFDVPNTTFNVKTDEPRTSNIPDQTFDVPNSNDVPNAAFDVPNSTFEVPNQTFAPNTTFDVANTTYDVANTTFEVPNKTFEVKEPVTEAKANLQKSEIVTSSWEPGEGWFLHPQTPPEDLTGQIDIQDGIDNSYVGFTLDEECVNALRNELAAKLPHAQGISNEEQEPEEWENEERNEVIVKYNVYATPLSPIPEESCCDDMFCDTTQHQDGSDSDSDWSEPGRTSQMEDILIVDTETHTALILESPSPREPMNRHTPSQDSCCSNDTLFNLEDLNYGAIETEQSPEHIQDETQNMESILKIVTPNESDVKSPCETPKELSLSEAKDEETTTKEDIITKINIADEESNTQPEKSKLKLNLEPGDLNVAPLPSPEDIPWRQLPASMLTYSQVALNDTYDIQESENTGSNITEGTSELQDLNLEHEFDIHDGKDDVLSEDGDLYNNLTDIRFSGPCDTQLMSTSFSESAEIAEDRDWDSGSDTRSSSSGEFIWKEGEHEESLKALHHDEGVPESVSPMEAIAEENSDTSDEDDEEIEETEFVPSAWDSQATPTKSALRSPEKTNKSKGQKGVWFKKEKYHCVYEYPREPESPVTQSNDLWRPLSDFSNYADLWELDPESCVSSVDDDGKECFETSRKFTPRDYYQLASGSTQHRDLYQLNSFPDFSSGTSATDDFFISSSAKPFQTLTQGSQFFPGHKTSLWQDYQQNSLQSGRDFSDNITPDSGIDDITPASISEQASISYSGQLSPPKNKVQSLKTLAALAANKTEVKQESLGGLRHTRNRLKLDLPPSPSSFTSTRSFNIELNTDPVVNREVPTFTTFGKSRFSVQHVQTPTEDDTRVKNVSFEALPYKPFKLEDVKTKYTLDDKHKPVEVVRGEASLLDSADEDSGIESSANATLERQVLN